MTGSRVPGEKTSPAGTLQIDAPAAQNLPQAQPYGRSSAMPR